MVHGLLDSARTGTSALAVRSEAGIGETALLDYLARRAEECGVIRAAGVEARWGLRSRCSISSACRSSLLGRGRLPLFSRRRPRCMGTRPNAQILQGGLVFTRSLRRHG